MSYRQESVVVTNQTDQDSLEQLRQKAELLESQIKDPKRPYDDKMLPRLREIQEQINRQEKIKHDQKAHPDDMSLSAFNKRREQASLILMEFIFQPNRRPGQKNEDPPLDTYSKTYFEQGKTFENSTEDEKINAARCLIAAYKKDKKNEAVVAEKHRSIVDGLSTLLSGDAVGRIPKDCILELKKIGQIGCENDRFDHVASFLSSFIGSGKQHRTGELDKAVAIMTKEVDSNTESLNKEEPSAEQFYHLQEWMVQILVKNYLTRRWKVSKDNDVLDQSECMDISPWKFLQNNEATDGQAFKRTSDGLWGLYNFFRSDSRSYNRGQHALETIQSIRQAMDVNALIRLLQERIAENQKGFFSYSLSGHSLDDNYKILITIADYANSTSQQTAWNPSSIIETWKEDCIEHEFDGCYGLFATHAHGLRPAM
ncbi:MAG: hypothetical protein GKR77_00720 [Legionellales bacterium]|nr:hypothetical protein [Legionellales bacterium]